jgi:hypothetical protein
MAEIASRAPVKLAICSAAARRARSAMKAQTSMKTASLSTVTL